MNKPRIFLGSSAKQAKLLQALTRGLEDIAHVEPWTASFNPGTTERLESHSELPSVAKAKADPDTLAAKSLPSPRAAARTSEQRRQRKRPATKDSSGSCDALPSQRLARGSSTDHPHPDDDRGDPDGNKYRPEVRSIVGEDEELQPAKPDGKGQ